MALHFKVQLVAVADEDQQLSVEDLIVLDKDHERPEQLGLTLAEAKALLLELQRQVLSRQIAAFLASRTPCPARAHRTRVAVPGEQVGLPGLVRADRQGPA